MTPFFSCVVPVKGSRPFLEEALDSLRCQGMGGDLETIVQDGDAEPDGGQSDALNRGFAKARGEWLFWLNADDLLLPGALAAVLRLASRGGGSGGAAADWIAGNLVYIDGGGKILKCAFDKGFRAQYDGFPARVFGPSSFFRRSLLERAGGLDCAFRYSMDTELWCRFRAGARLDGGRLAMGASQPAWFEKVPGYLWAFRVHAGSATSADLAGRAPAAMKAEGEMIDMRYGLRRTGWPLWRLRLARLRNGSYARSLRDTLRYRGRLVGEVFQ